MENKSGIFTTALAITVFCLLHPSSAAQAANAQRGSDARTTGYVDGRSNRVLRVNCNHGQKIGRALARARPRDVIRVRGICYEQIKIDKAHITLVGVNGATIDGGGRGAGKLFEGTVTVDGVRGITLKDLSVVNGPDIGIVARRGAQVRFDNVAANAHATTGIVIDNAQVELVDVTTLQNGLAGIDAFTNSTVIARGNVTSNSNAGTGIEINGNSFFELRGSAVVAGRNGGDGLLLANDSLLVVFSFPEAQGSSVTADSNGGNGLTIAVSQMNFVGSQFFGSGANVITATNNINGIFLSTASIGNPFGTARFDLRDNGVGVLAVDNASILSIGGFRVEGNGAGLIGDAAGTFTIVSIPPNPSAIVDNRIDIDLSFGSRATFDGVSAGSISCDRTVLVRGTVACP